jgi:hypothetical protein
MRRFGLVALFMMVGCTVGSDAPPGSASALGTAAGTRRLVTLQLGDFATEIRLLARGGFDVAGVNRPLRRVDVLVDDRELAEIRARGIPVVRSKDAPVSPAPRLTGPDRDYKNPDAVAETLNGYPTKYPQLASVRAVGKSLEGRDILAIVISKDVAHHSAAKPTILFNGMHHAREVMAAEVPLDTAEYLLTRYGKDDKVTHWVDANEIWIVPMLNVDGNNRVWTNDAMWRKNTHGCTAGTPCASGTGVDICRNYPYEWASCEGSSTDSSAEDFHGPSAASEPETRALMDVVRTARPVFDISYHSYAELVIYPYGCDGSHSEAKDIIEPLGKSMAAVLPTDDGTGTYTAGTAWETLYSVDGDDIDWMLHENSVIPFVIELNGDAQGFQPTYADWRDKTVTKLRAAWQLLLDRLDGSGIRGVVTGAPAMGTAVSVVDARAGTTQTRPLNPDGSFHFVLAPGAYHLSVTAPNHATFERDVTVADKRSDVTVPL